MKIIHVNLLQQQRNLYNLPRTMERFEAYLRVLQGDKVDDVALPPLVYMNPMGKGHVVDRLDQLLAIDADGIAQATLEEAVRSLSGNDMKEISNVAQKFLELQHGLVLVDDAQGGWTDRYATEAAAWFTDDHVHKRNWISTMLWSSENVTEYGVRESVLRSLGRTLHQLNHGAPKTLGDKLRQEGSAAKFSGMCITLDADDVAYSREVIYPHLETEDYGSCMAAMYGDAIARQLGFTPFGLSNRAGFAVALADALGGAMN